MKPRRQGLFYVAPDQDRRLISANEWYGFGFVAGITGVLPDKDTYARWYCGKAGAYGQYLLGLRHGRATQRTPCK